MLCKLNAEVLTHAGYQVDVAEDGAVAWQALQVYHYDLLITDNEMPNVSGLELLTKLKEAGLELPVIMATGSLPEEEFVRRPWLQPTDVLLKPYTLGELLGVVRKNLVNFVQAHMQTAMPSNLQAPEASPRLQA